MILTLRLSNWFQFRHVASSVVHTGVKSLGWENSTATSHQSIHESEFAPRLFSFEIRGDVARL